MSTTYLKAHSSPSGMHMLVETKLHQSPGELLMGSLLYYQTNDSVVGSFLPFCMWLILKVSALQLLPTSHCEVLPEPLDFLRSLLGVCICRERVVRRPFKVPLSYLFLSV